MELSQAIDLVRQAKWFGIQQRFGEYEQYRILIHLNRRSRVWEWSFWLMPSPWSDGQAIFEWGSLKSTGALKDNVAIDQQLVADITPAWKSFSMFGASDYEIDPMKWKQAMMHEDNAKWYHQLDPRDVIPVYPE